MNYSLEGAAGIAGVVKAVLVLERGVIPPNTNFEKLNPKIDADFLKIKVRFRCFETNAHQRMLTSSHPVSPRANAVADHWLASCVRELVWVWRNEFARHSR